MKRNFWNPANGKEFTKDEILSLKELYDEAVYEYYQTDSTTMSDLEFDELKEILEENGYDLSSEDMVEDVNVREKLTSENNMISLKKVQVFSEKFEQRHLEGVIKWLSQYSNTDENTYVHVGWKLDGCASSLRYDENGKLFDVVTRGNFSIAKKMLEVAMKQHPVGLPNSEIRCEMLMKKSTFHEKYENEYANPRNLVSGIVNDINVDDKRKWDIDFIACNDGLNPLPCFEKTDAFVDKDNFLVYNTIKLNEIFDLYDAYKSKRNGFEYPTDGLVVYLTNVKQFKHIGKYPLHSVAIKFPPTEAITTVKEIQWNLKKSGEWIPKAILEPVDLDGTEVKRTLVFNYGYVVDNKVYPGAQVVIAKNGDIIPYIQRVVKPGDESQFNIPEDTMVVGKHLYPKSNTGIIARERFIAGCYCLGIKNFGYAWFRGLAKLCDNHIELIFNKELVNERELKGLFGGDKKVKNFMQELNSIKSLSIYKVLRMLQIPGLGGVTATQVARYYSGISYSFTGLEKSVVESCTKGSNNTYIHNIIVAIENSGVKVEKLVEDTKEYGATYEMTGSPKDFGYSTKSEVEKILSNWKHTKLEKGTTYLITDDLTSTSAKMKKAQKNGTKIITYKQAVELHNN